ncbi:hypothetical protein HYC85_003259 [Camellia sinensis]|uniref:Uncharacterized protein n=1 Tax=Camellia sinensis TaxID=4442 RepID=A0A7J7IAS9_CAMSI|nr:hypothetical protein HYC85_003259 [Camellia sinensis]
MDMNLSEDRYDLVKFVKLVGSSGLYLHLRIGPYLSGSAAVWNAVFGGGCLYGEVVLRLLKASKPEALVLRLVCCVEVVMVLCQSQSILGTISAKQLIANSTTYASPSSVGYVYRDGKDLLQQSLVHRSSHLPPHSCLCTLNIQHSDGECEI